MINSENVLAPEDKINIDLKDIRYLPMIIYTPRNKSNGLFPFSSFYEGYARVWDKFGKKKYGRIDLVDCAKLDAFK